MVFKHLYSSFSFVPCLANISSVSGHVIIRQDMSLGSGQALPGHNHPSKHWGGSSPKVEEVTWGHIEGGSQEK